MAWQSALGTRLGTDLGDEGSGEGVDLGQRAADPEQLGEQRRGEKSGVFLVALVECLLDGIAKLRPGRRGEGGASGG